MIVYTLIHEYKEGFTAYAYSTRKKRAEARALLLKKFAGDFDTDKDFLIEDTAELDVLPCKNNAKV